jgi:hypothetical protein
MMRENTAIRIKTVESAGHFSLRVKWRSGKTTAVDLTEPVHRLKGLRPLRNEATFARATVGEGGHSIAWPNDLDMGADRLWELALEQNGRADAAEFVRWRGRHGLSLSDAAEALGLSRRQIAYYVSGNEAVPRYILLACKGWEAEQQQKAA